MTEMIPFRLGKDYTVRLDILANRLGLKRPFLVRNLLSGDTVLIDEIEAKAKTLTQVEIFDVATLNGKQHEKVPEVVTIRLDKEQERRFNALVSCLGYGTKVQILRNLLSGDAGTISTICTKAKSIAIVDEEVGVNSTSKSPFKEEIVEKIDAVEELVRRKVMEFERELRLILTKQSKVANTEELIKQEEPMVGFPNASDEQPRYIGNQVSHKAKRGRKKTSPCGIDHTETRKQIVGYFNLKSGRNLGFESNTCKEPIDKMLDAGKPLNEFMIIIDNMCYWWKEVSPNMYSSLFPKTIFRVSHWDQYLSNTPPQHKGPTNSTTNKTSDKYQGFYL